MGNMSYCRFRNTLRDLGDCKEALEMNEPLSDEEHRAARRLIELAREIADEHSAEDLRKESDEDPDDEDD